MSGKTPMTNLKVMAAGVAVLLVMAYAGYTMFLKPGANNGEQSYVSGQIISGDGAVQLSLLPIAVAQAETPTAAPTIAPTVAPTATPEPTTPPDSVYPRGNVVYVTPKPTAPPTPILGENMNYKDSWNYFKCTGLNLNYDLKQNLQLKAGSTFNLKAVIQNQKAPIEHVYGTLTATTLNADPNLNIVLFTTPIYDERKFIAQYETFTIDQSVTVPAIRGHYKLYVVIACDNGAKAEIMQEVTIV